MVLSRICFETILTGTRCQLDLTICYSFRIILKIELAIANPTGLTQLNVNHTKCSVELALPTLQMG